MPSRAFVHFSDADKMYLFAEKFDGHKFVDGKGTDRKNCFPQPSVEIFLSRSQLHPLTFIYIA
jgi:hypothetical protein